MTTLLTLSASIVAALASVVVMTITVWNTTPLKMWRHRRFARKQEREKRKHQEQWIKSMRTNPVLLELESRFDELVAAREARDASPDLRRLWVKAFDLTKQTPVDQPLGFGDLVILNREEALIVGSGGVSILQRRHLDLLRPPVVMASTLGASASPATVIK